MVRYRLRTIVGIDGKRARSYPTASCVRPVNDDTSIFALSGRAAYLESVMPPSVTTRYMTTDRLRRDFDHIASLGDRSDSGSNRYDSYLLSLVPASAARILDVGCGVGRRTNRLASGGRFVAAVDLSPGMVARARAAAEHPERMHFICGDFLGMQFEQSEFDCIVSAATLHHMPGDTALAKIGTLVKPGGRVIIHDIRHGSGIVDALGMGAILGYESVGRLLTTGSPLSPRRVRQAWKDHAAGDYYVTMPEAEELFERHLPGTRVHRHWGWRYTAIWDRPAATD